MYQDLFDEKQRLHLIHSKDGQIAQRGYRQSGEFESGILCQDCDNQKLGKLERYASLILFDGHPKIIEPRQTPEGLRFIYCAKIDYTQFKLFLISILWRASISSRPLFQEVDLGPYEERLRQMLLDGDPGDQMDFPCLVLTYLNVRELPSDVVSQPSRAKVDGGFVYKFLIGGMIYIFFVTKRIAPAGLADVAISPSGEMKVIYATPQFARSALGNMLGLNLG